MGFWNDLGAATEEFSDKYTTARRFRIQRESDAQRQALQRQELDLRKSELQKRISDDLQAKAINGQLTEMATRVQGIIGNPLNWQVQAGRPSIRPEFLPDLMSLATQMGAMAYTPAQVSRVNQIGDLIKSTIPSPPPPQPAKPNAVVEKFEGLKAIGYSEDDARRLAGGDKEKADPEESPDVGDIAPFMKVLGEQGIDPSKVPDAVVRDSFKSFVKQRRELEKTPKPEGLSFTTPSRPIQGTTVHYPTRPATPAEEPIINEPQDTVEVDINDPRLRDTTFTETPFGIDVKAPATAEDEPTSEDEVRQYVEEYKVGKKPFPTYKVARQYFKRALEKGFTTRKFYDTFHNKFISPMYPDTTK